MFEAVGRVASGENVGVASLEGTRLVREEHSPEKTGVSCYYWMCHHHRGLSVSKLNELELLMEP